MQEKNVLDSGMKNCISYRSVGSGCYFMFRTHPGPGTCIYTAKELRGLPYGLQAGKSRDSSARCAFSFSSRLKSRTEKDFFTVSIFPLCNWGYSSSFLTFPLKRKEENISVVYLACERTEQAGFN